MPFQSQQSTSLELRLPNIEFDLTPRKERRDAAAHRQRILAAARELFATRGVENTTMQDVARAAGVGQGTLYRRYAHKGELCSGVLGERMEQFCVDVRTALETEHAQAPALAQLEVLLVRIAEFNEASGPLLGAISDAAAGQRHMTNYSHPLYQWLHKTVVVLLQRAVTQGEIAPIDVACSADLVLAPLDIDLYRYQRNQRGYTPERILAAVRQLFFTDLRVNNNQKDVLA